MRARSLFREKVAEAVKSVLPIALVILLLCFTITPMPSGVFLSFLFGTVLLVVGMGLFSLGSEIAMTPMGDYVGARMAKSRKIWVVVVLSFFVGALITISEPDLQVLAEQVPSIDNNVLIFSVAAGVGAFLVLAVLRVIFSIRLRYMLLGFYVAAFILAAFVNPSFWAVAFDSGGVTTGPMTVPFIMALGVGVSAIRSEKAQTNDSFGYVALCSVGPIVAVLVLGLVYSAGAGDSSAIVLPEILDSRALAMEYIRELPHFLKEVLIALAPIGALFFLMQAIVAPMNRRNLARIGMGLLYTLIGLVLFLTGANVGFMPAGRLIGEALGGMDASWIAIPIGMVLGYCVVSAEPAIHVLEQQVEEVTAGAIPKKALSLSLSIGVSVSVGLALLRALTGWSIMYFLIPGYLVAMALTFFCSDTFTAIAFDSGGVASGPMTATFLLALSMGVCTAVGGNIVTDAFGVVAMVAMTPLITIQVLGVIYGIKLRRAKAVSEPQGYLPPDDDVIDL
jgi:hypothetical protein